MKLTSVKSLFLTLTAVFVFTQSVNAEERVLATVDGYPIMASEVQRMLGKKANTEANRKVALDQTIDDFLVQKAIQQSGLKVDYTQVDRFIEGVAARNGLTYGQLLDALEYQGINYQQYRQQIAHQMLMEEIKHRTIGQAIEVSPQEVQQLAKDMLKKAKETGKMEKISDKEYRVSHILLKLNPLLNDAQAKAKLNEIITNIKAGKTTFEAEAKTNSVDYLSAVEGGDLGWNFPDIYDPTFAKVIKGSKIGVISAPFKSKFGWHILKVTDTRLGDRTEDAYHQKAYEQLVNKQAQAAAKDWIKVLKQKADIHYIAQ